jgi:hypothetical protein
MSLLCPPDLLPDLTDSTLAFFRLAYGLLLLGTLLLAFRNGLRFFLSDRWGGYAKSSAAVDALHNPIVMPLVMAVWLTSAVLLTVGEGTIWAAAINAALCYYYFIWMRWRGVLRGMGAPGFMTWWLAAAVLVLELAQQYAPGVRPLAIFVFQVDFALIIFSAGLYKLNAGYFRNQGMEFGMVNPQWGYLHRYWSKWSPRNPWFFFLNQNAWSVQMLSAVLMLVPQTRFIGAMMIVLSFVFIATQIRLALLCPMVMLCGVLYFAPGTIGATCVDWLPGLSNPAAGAARLAWLEMVLGALLGAYLVLLPVVHGGLFVNFYGHKALPGRLQRVLEWYTNLTGIIIWRVFSADHTDFFIRIWSQAAGGKRSFLSDYWRVGSRFNHVGESITVTSAFTSLKYYPSNNGIFQERLLRYARTLPCPAGAVLVFEYVSVRKNDGRFEYLPVSEFVVDPATSTITERSLSTIVCIRSASRVSPVHEASRPGSYVKAS